MQQVCNNNKNVAALQMGDITKKKPITYTTSYFICALLIINFTYTLFPGKCVN